MDSASLHLPSLQHSSPIMTANIGGGLGHELFSCIALHNTGVWNSGAVPGRSRGSRPVRTPPKGVTAPLAQCSFSDQIDAENVAGRWAIDRRKAGMLISGNIDRPSGMFAGIHAVKLTVIYRDVV